MHGSEQPHNLNSKVIHANILISNSDNEPPTTPNVPSKAKRITPSVPARPDEGVNVASRFYDRVAVLLIKWADEFDELKTGAEVKSSQS